jgi:hypothetical protein
MSPKEKFDACIKLAEFGAGRWDARRQYEWKITLAIWALLAAGIGQTSNFNFPWWYGVLVIAGHAFWLRNLWLANQYDKDIMTTFQRGAEKLLENHVVFKPPKKWRIKEWMLGIWLLRRSIAFLIDWSVVFQLGVTIFLVMVFYTLNKGCPTQV